MSHSLRNLCHLLMTGPVLEAEKLFIEMIDNSNIIIPNNRAKKKYFRRLSRSQWWFNIDDIFITQAVL